MKSVIINLALLLSILLPLSGFAMEYLWIDEHGNRVFDCGGLKVGGKAAIRLRAPGIYRVKGVLINREIRANSVIHAAQIACGEAEEMPKEQPPTETEKDDE